ncbi:MAG: hypothetical protein JW871_03645 [Endomicrobiales bacterium]|nr:hypothetical protein [Endomicrobiales bacterium]
MSAKKLLLDVNKLMEGKNIKIDLTPKEIELILILLNKEASSDILKNSVPIYSPEELQLLKKLESALESEISQDIVSPGHISNIKH